MAYELIYKIILEESSKCLLTRGRPTPAWSLQVLLLVQSKLLVLYKVEPKPDQSISPSLTYCVACRFIFGFGLVHFALLVNLTCSSSIISSILISSSSFLNSFTSSMCCQCCIYVAIVKIFLIRVKNGSKVIRNKFFFHSTGPSRFII